MLSPEDCKEKEQMICSDALSCQDACNLSGVLHSASRHVSELWDIANSQGHGTDWVNTYPAIQLFAYKLFALAFKHEPLGSAEVSLKFGDAYNFCRDLERGE